MVPPFQSNRRKILCRVFHVRGPPFTRLWLSDRGPRPRRPTTRETPGARATLKTRAALTTPSARGRAALARDDACALRHCCPLLRLSRFSGHAAAASICVSMRCDFPSILAQTSLAGASHTFKPSNLATTQKATPAAATPAAATPTAATPAAATPAAPAATPATIPAAARRCHRPPLQRHRCNACRDRTSNPLPKGGRGIAPSIGRPPPMVPPHGPTAPPS